MAETRNNSRKHAALLSLLAVSMFGFAFALVPLYQVFCEITGLNGKTSGQAAEPVAGSQVSDREITIQFLARVAKGMPWEFRPDQHQLRVIPGEINTTAYYARNRASGVVIGQAIPSVSPGQAARHLHKVECFCFTQQQLTDGEDVWMPLQFYVDDDLPEDIRTISLSYSMYKMPTVQETQTVAVGYPQ